MDNFTREYIGTALWAETGDDGEPLDATYDADDLAPMAIFRAETDCARFRELVGADAIAGREDQAAHDFWLTRNGHGAGFWDGDWSEPHATALTEAAHAMGELSAIVGDNGRIYFE